MTRIIKLLLLAGVAALAACNGRVNLDVTDASVDKVKNIFVQFGSVTLKPAAGGAVTVTFNPPLTLDLLALEGGGTARLLDNQRLTDGNYASLSLAINADGSGKDSYVVLDDAGTQRPLQIASGTATLTGGFSVKRDGTRNYVIDFDLRKSVLDPKTGTTIYRLQPALRLVDRDNSGAIAGVFAGAGADGCKPAVYVYAGSGAILGDEGSAHPPLTSTRAKRRQDTTPVSYTYKVAFLDPGTYTVATTCQADADNPEIADEAIGLQNATEVQVQTGTTATVNF